MIEPMNNLIPIKEAAERCNKNVDTLKIWARRGKIRAYKLAGSRWFIDADSLDNLYEPVGEDS
jgi:excisionase family DNA binding protein